MTKATSKLILSLVLLVSAAFLPHPAQSLTCCQNCQNNLTLCYRSCGGNPTCETNCDNAYTSCAMRCPGCPF